MPETTSPAETTQAERAYRDLRRALVRCEYEPGERLRVEALSRRYELSSSPLREALNRLAEQGLVQAFENRGFHVAPLTVDEITDLTRVRLLVESEALRQAMTLGDDAWEAGVVAAAHGLSRLEQRLGDGPLVLDEAWSNRHRDFHLAIHAGCGSPLLLDLVGSLFDKAERYRQFSARHRTARRAKHDEHQRLMKAVLARDEEKALARLRAHISGTQGNVVACLLALQARPN